MYISSLASPDWVSRTFIGSSSLSIKHSLLTWVIPSENWYHWLFGGFKGCSMRITQCNLYYIQESRVERKPQCSSFFWSVNIVSAYSASPLRPESQQNEFDPLPFKVRQGNEVSEAEPPFTISPEHLPGSGEYILIGPKEPNSIRLECEFSCIERCRNR